MICGKCKKNVPIDSMYCPYCGNKVFHDKKKREFKNENLRRNVIIIVLIAPLLLFAIFLSFDKIQKLCKDSTRRNLINELVQNIEKNDFEKVRKQVSFYEFDGMKFVNEDLLKVFCDYLNSEIIIDGVKYTAKEYLSKLENKSLMSLNKNIVVFKPLNFIITSNEEIDEIYLNDVLFSIKERDESNISIGPIPPIPILFSARKDTSSGYSSVEKTYNPFIKDKVETVNYVEFEFNVRQLFLKSTIGEAVIYVDKKITDDVLRNEYQEYGPYIFASNSRVNTEISLPWGNFLSQELIISSAKDSQKYLFKYDVISKNVKNTIVETISSFNEQYSKAFNSSSIYYLKNVTREKKDYVANQLEELYKENLRTEMRLVDYKLDLDSIRYHFENGIHGISVKCFEQYEQYTWKSGYKKSNKFRLNPPQDVTYFLVYVEKEWLIRDWVIEY